MTYEQLMVKISFEPTHHLREALRAVVELHQPIYTFIADSDKSVPLCIQCRDGDFIADYPCNTITSIMKALVTNVDN